ncbi:MAG: aminoacetone oxidase family FAD-binding enzyme [Christensenellaceae bacterium]
MKRYTIAIVGGGASGMMCALELGRLSARDVIIIEKNDRVGKKLSATGNGQGNLTNTRMGTEHYFSSDLSIVGGVLAEFTERDTMETFRSIGGLLLPDERGRVYPASRQGSSATDLLRFALERAGVELKTGVSVTRINSDGRGFTLALSNGEELNADYAVLATGGKAAKQFGTDGSAYALAKSFGHTLTPLYPSLVQCKTDGKELRSLKGIRTEVNLSFEGHTERGDLIFTDYGVSGDSVFRLSSYFTGKEGELLVEFLPDVSEKELFAILDRKRVPEGELFCGILPNQIGRLLLRKAGSVKEAVRLVKRFPLRMEGTLGFDYAQVTKGGVPMDEVTARLESKRQRNLFLTGELLDVDGECGGYNLQWAFASGAVAAREIVCRL